MNVIILINLVFFLICVLNRISSISIVVNNIEILENPDEYNLDRLLDIVFINDDIHANNNQDIYSLDSNYICILVDAIECHCSNETYADTILLRTFIFPKSCIDRVLSKKFYWFSIKLTNMNHVPSRVIMTVPLQIENKNQNVTKMIDNYLCTIISSKSDLLTLVLPLTIDDFSRSLILFQSLRLIPIDTVLELLIFVPENDYHILEVPIMAIMNGNNCMNSISRCYNFTTTIYSEQVLFQRLYSSYKHTTYPYALQMAIKLLASKFIQTSYYMTLDADIILLHSFTIEQVITHNNILMSNDKIFKKHKALYHYESRSVHENWWKGSENLIGINTRNRFVYSQQIYNNNNNNNDDNRKDSDNSDNNLDQGFGVTPAILSTFGSLLTISSICNNLIPTETRNEYDENVYMKICETLWLDGLGKLGEPSAIWSEYTVYRIVLDHYELFDELHIRENTSNNPARLHCYNVWYSEQLPWFADKAAQDTHCLFSVIQSSTGVSPRLIYEQYLYHVK